jgi:hypothetical protein
MFARGENRFILQVELRAPTAHTPFMRRFGLIIGLWMGLLCHAASAGTYALTDGSRVSGDPISFDDTGVLLKTGEGSYSPRISWGKFTDEALRQLRDEAKNPHDRALVEPMVSDETPSEKAKFRQITVKPVETPARPSGRLGILAIFTSPLGWMVLLILYATNLFAAYEIAIFRNQPLPTVCGLAAIPFFGVASSIYFLAVPGRPLAGRDSSPAGGAPVQPSYTPTPLPSTAPDGDAAPMAAEGFPSFSPLKPPGPSPVAAAPAEADLPAPLVFQRGEFSFNRRFFETKLAGFFRVVLSGEDKDLLIHIKSARGVFVGKRISRITPAELYLQVFKDNATADEMIPFVEILEVQIRHKDLT